MATDNTISTTDLGRPLPKARDTGKQVASRKVLRMEEERLRIFKRARLLASQQSDLAALVNRTAATYGDREALSRADWIATYGCRVRERSDVRVADEHLELCIPRGLGVEEVISDIADQVRPRLRPRSKKQSKIPNWVTLLRKDESSICLWVTRDVCWSNANPLIRNQIWMNRITRRRNRSATMERALSFFEIYQELGAGAINADFVGRLRDTCRQRGGCAFTIPHSVPPTEEELHALRRLKRVALKLLKEAAEGSLFRTQ
jgi:hypothetical protein